MLRLPKFEVATPSSVTEAVALLSEPAVESLVVAGGTDLVPNMKHELFTPDRVVSLGGIPELVGIRREDDGTLAIGAMTTLAEVAASDVVRQHAPALGQAAGLVAGPQLRTMGTLGGNVLLDTRCQWYNQTYFWREALGFCLKKDGTVCHVVEGGRKCVAAASNDTAPPLMTRGAELVFEGPDGRRTTPIDAFWRADGIVNKKIEAGEILVEIRIPPVADDIEHHGAYGKLRTRGSIDFPLLGVAVRLDVATGLVAGADIVVTALAAKPVRLKRVEELVVDRPLGGREFTEAVDAIAERAYKQCTPLANVPGDEEYRKEMVPVYVRRTLQAAAQGSGPVHHL